MIPQELRRLALTLLPIALVLSWSPDASAKAKAWKLDTVHSQLGFGVSHLLVTTTRGTFKSFGGEFMVDAEDFTKSSFNVGFDIASIDTNNEKRDAHLRSGDFFKADEFPRGTFISKKVKKTKKKGVYLVTGDLTMRGITKPVTIEMKVAGPAAGMGGGQVFGIHGEATINRHDWGISWNKNLDAGGVAVGDDVEIEFDLELHG